MHSPTNLALHAEVCPVHQMQRGESFQLLSNQSNCSQGHEGITWGVSSESYIPELVVYGKIDACSRVVLTNDNAVASLESAFGCTSARTCNRLARCCVYSARKCSGTSGRTMSK